MISVTVNGEEKYFPDGSSVLDLIKELNLSMKKFAIEVNEEIIPRSQHQQYQLKKNDIIEVVIAVGGG